MAEDLHTQFEELLNEVRAAERNWTLDDKIDLAMKQRRGSERSDPLPSSDPLD